MEGTQNGLECTCVGDGVEQERLHAWRECAGGSGERRRGGKEAAHGWHRRGAVEQRRRSGVRAKSSGGVAASCTGASVREEEEGAYD